MTGLSDSLEDAQRFSLRLPALAINLTVVRQAITGAAIVAGLSSPEIEDVKVAVTEACTNAVMHAYPGATGEMDVTAWASPERLVLRVLDFGQGIGGAGDGTKKGLGLGLGLIAALAEEVDVGPRPGGGTQVWMSFAAHPDLDDADPPLGAVVQEH